MAAIFKLNDLLRAHKAISCAKLRHMSHRALKTI